MDVFLSVGNYGTCLLRIT